jgi:hypothetical protein
MASSKELIHQSVRWLQRGDAALHRGDSKDDAKAAEIPVVRKRGAMKSEYEKKI